MKIQQIEFYGVNETFIYICKAYVGEQCLKTQPGGKLPFQINPIPEQFKLNYYVNRYEVLVKFC